jgi:PAS domain-containing protein
MPYFVMTKPAMEAPSVGSLDLIDDQNLVPIQNLLDHLPCAAYTCDSEGLITYYNPKAKEFWGRAPKLHDPLDRY